MACSIENVNTLDGLERKLKEVSIPWDEIAPQHIQEWLDIFAISHGTRKELLLPAMLSTTSGLIGANTKVRLFGTLEETGNLYFHILANPGTAKTPACKHGCIIPLVNHLEPKVGQTLLVDDTSVSGLFHFFSTQDAANVITPILCVDEAHEFYKRLAFPSKSSTQTNLSLERLCKLHDSDYCMVHC